MTTPYYAPDLTEARRRAMFFDLVMAQDQELDVPGSRERVARQHGLAVDEVRAVEREGLDKQWPPLS